MLQKREITQDEYVNEFHPRPGWVLILKDSLSEKYGSLYIPKSAADRVLHYASSGVIKKMYSGSYSEECDSLKETYKVGVRVGFNTTVPILAPLPPNCEFTEASCFVTMHISDILGYFKEVA